MAGFVEVSAQYMCTSVLSDVSIVFHLSVPQTSFRLPYVMFATGYALDTINKICTSARDVCACNIFAVRKF